MHLQQHESSSGSNEKSRGCICSNMKTAAAQLNTDHDANAAAQSSIV
jgi:hypothetical protein